MINRDAFLATMKGPPLSVYVCFLIYGQRTALRPTFIARKTRYSRQAVYDALYFLHSHGYLQELPGLGWVATTFLQQQTFDLFGTPDADKIAAPGVNQVDTVNLVDSPPPSSSCSSDLSLEDQDQTTTTTEPESVNSVYTSPAEIAALCQQHGIFEAQATYLATDPWVTRERIEAWVAALEQDPGVRSVPAVLYSNLKHHREPPAPATGACSYEKGGYPAIVCPRCGARPCMCEE